VTRRGLRHGAAWAALALGLAGAGAAEPAAPAATAPTPPGAEALRRGDFAGAAASLEAAAEAARAADDADAELRARLALAEAQQGLGHFAEAVRTLERALALAEASGDAARRAAVRGALGNSYVAAGDFERAGPLLSEATAEARAAKSTALAAALGNNLGNLHALRAARAQGAAREAAQRAGDAAYADAGADAHAAGDAQLGARVLANRARLALAAGAPERCRELAQQAEAALAAAPAGHEAVLTRIHLGRTWIALIEAQPRPASADLLAAHALLARAQEDAGAAGDLRGRAWAEGTQGALYAASGRREDALELTRRALSAAEQAGAQDAQLRFQAQAAELLGALGREDEALAAYRVAVKQLAELRPALALAYGAELSFEAGPGRAYRQLVDLLLRRAAREPSDGAALLSEAQQVMERFKAAELRDYFQDDCVDAWRARITTAADASLGALVVYPIALDDRLELLVSGRSGMRRYSVPVPREELVASVRSLRRLLTKRTTREYLPHAQRLYAWLVAPYAAQLAAERPQALVFVPDGALRTIPMAALHDGARFLVEKIPLATTPGLELTDPRPLASQGARFLLGGVASAVQGYEELPHVREELDALHARFGGDLLLDGDFVEPTVAARIEGRPYAVVHLASHGVVGADARQSYLLTYDGRIDLQELSAYLSSARYREQPIELIALSACETAAGDDRAALGLSGLAVKAGARSALGALWNVNDAAASQLMVSFYRELALPGTSRAQALARAQRELIADLRTRHPAYWAPFLLISNWL
jgi:CHAT domain-containing protein